MKLLEVLKPGMKGVFYGRHSTDEQEMLMQQNSVHEFAKKYNCSIIDEYLDPGVSAFKKGIRERKNLTRLLADAQNHKFDFVAIYTNDRIARDPREHEFIRLTMRVCGIPIVVSSSDSLYDSQDDLLAQLLKDGLSKYEVENLKSRTRDGLEAKAKRGYWTGGNPPFGYSYVKQDYCFVAYPEELEIVRRIFNQYIKEEGFASIAASLPLGSYRGKDWTKERVKAVVINPFYAGYLSWGKRQANSNSFTPRDGWILAKSEYIEPIITIEEWEYCWKIYQNKKEGKVPPKHIKTSFLLRDIAICKDCLARLQTKDQRTSGNNGKTYGKQIYFCSSCGIRLDAEDFHQIVTEELLTDLSSKHTQMIYIEVISSFEKDKKLLERQIINLMKAINEYQAQKNQLELEIKQRMMNMISEEDKKLVEILTRYRLSLGERIRISENQIKEKEDEMNDIDKTRINSSTWLAVLEELSKPSIQFKQEEIRRLVVNLVDTVFVDRELRIEIKARYDLKRRKMIHSFEN